MYKRNMAHFHVKKKKGRPYLYVREIARVDGRPKVVKQIYIGSPERVAALVSEEADEEATLSCEEFGALWLANRIDRDVDLAGLVDEVVPRSKKEKGPSVGEYFLYCVLNRMVETRSKNRLGDWYHRTAIQQIRPVDIDELTSQRYWEKWDRVGEKDLEDIGHRFFEKIWKLESPEADCLLFDTTNYYTFMASDTDSDLAVRGKNKAGRHHLRQIGLGLLVSKESRLPLYYKVYPGNLHDSRLFRAVMDEMFGIVCGLNRTKERLTVVIDKGMNSEANYAWIDEHSRIHFVTTYSTYFAEELATTPMDYFEPVDIEKNRRLEKDGKEGDGLLAYRTDGFYWDKRRTVVVTHNPVTARKQNYTLDSKLEILRQELIEMRAKVRDREPHWRNPRAIEERYLRICERYHIPSDLYTLEFETTRDGLTMSFRRDAYRVRRKREGFGRNIIITDNTDWPTSDIVQSSLDRWEVENRFRLSNDDELVNARPVRHWTDSKIRCHLFTCIVAMTYLRMLERGLLSNGIKRTASMVMDDMRHLHSVLSLKGGRRKPQRRLENPSKTQAEVLSAFGCRIDKRGVLQESFG
jgi:transposase